MSQNIASQNVSRLKELLFDGETRALADLARRVELVASSGEQQRRDLAGAIGRQIEQHARTIASESAARADDVQRLDDLVRSLSAVADGTVKDSREQAQRLDQMVKRLEALAERAGSDESLEIAVSRVVDGALRRADTERHMAVSDAMAPFVVRTVKTEIRNSQDDLVEALYPMTGRMVKAYVASAMAELMEQVNRKLKTSPLMLRLKSVTTGRPMAELALIETQRLAVEEVYLIRRGTGELLGRWPDAPAQANRDQVMSGVLTAINDFSAEAFKEDGSALRHIDLESSQVFLRASPTYLLALRCSGKAHASVERIIDDEFLAAIERHHDLLAAASARPGAEAASDHTDHLGSLADRLTRRIGDKQDELTRPPFGLTPLRIGIVFFLLPLAGWLGWTATEAFKSSHVRSVAQRVIETSSEVKGYPISIDVAPWGRRLSISGLTPSTVAREDVAKRLRDLLPSTELDDQLTVVPTGGVDTRPQIARVRNELSRMQIDAQRSALARVLDRSRLRLQQTLPDLAALHDSAADDEATAAVARSVATVERIAAALAADGKRLGDPSVPLAELNAMQGKLEDAARDLADARANLIGLLGGDARPAPAEPSTKSVSTIDAAEDMAAQTERLAATAIAVHQASIVGRRPAPERVVVAPAPPREPTAVERLTDLLRTHVVWFANQTDFRDDRQASALLDRAARLVKDTGVLVRVVGFTDDQGSIALNTQLAQARARRVADDLVARGVPRERLVVVGRPGSNYDISPTHGPGSANRRVEMQIGYEGEDAAQ